MKDFENMIGNLTGNPEFDYRSWRSFVTPPEKTGAGQAEAEARQRLGAYDFSCPEEQQELFGDLIEARKTRVRYETMRNLLFAGGVRTAQIFPSIETMKIVYKRRY